MQETDSAIKEELSFPLEMVRWWEKKRYIYNAILVLSSTLTLYSLWDYTGPMLSKSETIIQAIWWVFLCNVLYTSAWAGGILKYYYIGSYPLSPTSRWVLFGLGSLFSIILIYIEFIFALDVLFAD